MDFGIQLDSWASWEGIEVEGRLHGLKTTFLSNYPLPETFHHHVYLRRDFINRHGFELAKSLVAQGHIITLEADSDTLKTCSEIKLKSPCSHLIHIMLVLQIDIDLLDDNDTVRFDSSERIYTASKYSFKTTEQSDYRGDRPLITRY